MRAVLRQKKPRMIRHRSNKTTKMDGEEVLSNSRNSSQLSFHKRTVDMNDNGEAAQFERTQSSRNDIEFATKVPKVSEDKHVFLSYCSDDLDEVMAAANQFKQRFNVSCIISARELQSSEDFIANIKDSMNSTADSKRKRNRQRETTQSYHQTVQDVEDRGINGKPSPCRSDECSVSNEDNGERGQSGQINNSHNDIHLAEKVPKLPENKDRHLFVSYSNADFNDVWAIVNQLEQRFQVSCIISARDFQPGKDIIANIKESINRSMKTVFMLTPNFVQSGFCKFERDVAFMASIESGINNVIPVMLHECDVPTSLSTLTYIDATYPGIDVPAKIVEAMIPSELAAGILISEDHALSKKYKNGYCVQFKSRSEKIDLGIKLPAYTFNLEPGDMSRLQMAKIGLEEAILLTMLQYLNQISSDECCSLAGDILTETEALCKWVYASVCIWHCVVAFAFFDGNLQKLLQHTTFCWMFIVISMFLMVFSLVPSFVMVSKVKEKQSRLKNVISVQPCLWEKFSNQCLQYNCIPVLEGRSTWPPLLHIMRYNTYDCKIYLAALIRSRGRPSESETPEEKAEAIIKRSLIHLKKHLTPSLDEIPDAPYNRHNVRKSKMCLCQMVETGSQLVNGPEQINGPIEQVN